MTVRFRSDLMMDLSCTRSIARWRCLLYGVVVLFVIIESSWSQDSFYFDPAPVSQDVIEGEDLRLRCDVSSRRYIAFYWTLDGRTLINSTRRYQDSSDLRILSVNRTLDLGSFRCVAVNVSTGIAVRSAEARLNILWLDTPTLVPQAQSRQSQVDSSTSSAGTPATVDEGVPTEITLKCLTDGNPDPTIEWMRNRVRIYPTERYRIQRNRLKIVGVRYSDNGVYSCRARSLAGAGLQAESKDAYLLNVPGVVGTPFLDVDTFTSSVIARRRMSATLNCVFSNATSTTWYFDQLPLVSTSKYVLHSNGSLTVNQVDADDVGVYRCAASSSPSSSVPDQIFAAQLHLAFLDDVTDSLFEPRLTSPVVIPLNGKLEIRCVAPLGLPTPTVRWEGPNGPILNERGRIKIMDSTQLVINDVEVTDAGEYQCIIENMAATRSGLFTLVVLIPPKITRGPQSQTVTEGSSATFECRIVASSYPATVISWKKDGELLDTRDTRWRVNQSAGTLSISSVRYADDGEYSCIVNSKPFAPLLSSTARLYVTKRLVFRTKPVDTRLAIGSEASILCTADGPGSVAPSITWRRVGYVTLPGHVRDVAGVLQFGGVRTTDSGSYICTATSSDKQQTIDVTIRVDVSARSSARQPSQNLNISVSVGRSTVLNCVVPSSRSSSVRWIKHGEVSSLDPGRFKILSNGSLYIAVVFFEDAGWYSCVNVNDDTERHTLYLDVLGDDAPSQHDSTHSVAMDANSGDHMTKTIVIAVSCVVAYLGIMAALTVYCLVHMVRARRMRKLQTSNIDNHMTNNPLNGDKSASSVNEENVHLMMAMLDRQRSSGVSGNHKDFTTLSNDLDVSMRSGGSGSSPIYNDVATLQSSTRIVAADVPSFSRNQLQVLGVLGKGDYGDIMLARIDEPGRGQTAVMVKSLLSSTAHHQAVFQHEVELFARGTHHRHVASLVGVCYSLQPPLLVTEYCELGDLKRLLRSGAIPLSITQRVVICHQAALAVAFCASSQLVHGDIAARNFLVSRTCDVKLSNVAASRGVDSEDYCELGNRLVPIRWLAPETAIAGNSSTCSDVWSYAVFVGEVFSNGATPFAGMTNDDVILALASGSGRPLCPPGCPDAIQHLVDECTDHRPRDRPSASQLAAALDKILSDFTF